MSKRAIWALALVVALTVPTAAAATNWIKLSGRTWVDEHSIRVNGKMVTYRYYSGKDAPIGEGENGSVRMEGIDCATRHWYEMRNGKLVPTDEDPELELNEASIDDPVYQAVCRGIS